MSPPIPGTSLAVATDRLWSLRLFYQLIDGHIEQSRHLDGIWTRDHLDFSPIGGSSLASITYGDGREVRVYYLDYNYIVQEFCYSEGRGWYHGEIGQLGVKATHTGGLAAIAYGSDVLGSGEEGVHIRVYYQEAGTEIVAELANDGYWHNGDLRIIDSQSGTRLAAVAYYFQDQTQIRVYYQDHDLYLKEYGHDDNGWFEGEFNPGKVLPLTPLSAIAFGDVQLQVYYRDLENRIVFVKNTGAWGDASVIEVAGPGNSLAVLQWESGNRLRVYYQESDSYDIIEFCSDNAGQSWFPGGLRVGE